MKALVLAGGASSGRIVRQPKEKGYNNRFS